MLNAGIAVRDNSGADYIAAFLILLYPCFKHILPISLTIPLFVVGGILLMLRHFRPANIKLWSLALIPVAAISLLGEMVTGAINADHVAFILGILFFSAIAGDRSWGVPFFNVLIALCLVHAFATVLFLFYPEIGRTVINNSLLSQYATARDYRSGLTGSYSWNGMYVALGFILSSALLLGKRRKSYLLLSVVFLGALMLTTKRAHFLFSLAAFIMTYFVANRERGIGKVAKLILILGIAAIAFLVVASFYPEFDLVFNRLTAQVDNTDEFLSGRTGLWKHAWEEWQSSPIFGHGWGSFKFYWIDGGTPVVSVAAHCVPLQLLAECGIVGLLITAIPTIYIIKEIIWGASNIGVLGEADRVLALESVAFFTFFFLYSLCGNPLYDVAMFIPFFSLYSLVSGGFPVHAQSNDSRDFSKGLQLKRFGEVNG